MDEVVGVMRDNVNKVLERDVKLSELDTRAEDLEAASNSFATSAKKVRKKMWWENLKMKLIIGGVVLAILIIIITIIAVKVWNSITRQKSHRNFHRKIMIIIKDTRYKNNNNNKCQKSNRKCHSTTG